MNFDIGKFRGQVAAQLKALDEELQTIEDKQGDLNRDRSELLAVREEFQRMLGNGKAAATPKAKTAKAATKTAKRSTRASASGSFADERDKVMRFLRENQGIHKTMDVKRIAGVSRIISALLKKEREAGVVRFKGKTRAGTVELLK